MIFGNQGHPAHRARLLHLFRFVRRFTSDQSESGRARFLTTPNKSTSKASRSSTKIAFGRRPSGSSSQFCDPISSRGLVGLRRSSSRGVGARRRRVDLVRHGAQTDGSRLSSSGKSVAVASGGTLRLPRAAACVGSTGASSSGAAATMLAAPNGYGGLKTLGGCVGLSFSAAPNRSKRRHLFGPSLPLIGIKPERADLDDSWPIWARARGARRIGR
jgi:hypothetical protein